jgi:hypothetical protein
MGIYYDHGARRAFTTELRRDPKTGAVERFITGEIPYTGESPLASPAQESGPTLSPTEADRLQQDLQGFLLHSDDSPLDPATREQMARRLQWQREHGGNR